VVGGAETIGNASTELEAKTLAQDLAMLRLTAQGTLDRSFGFEGYSFVSIPPKSSSQPTLLYAQRVAAQGDKFVVAATVDYQDGTNDVVLVRYLR